MSESSAACDACRVTECPSRGDSACHVSDGSSWQVVTGAILSFLLPLLGALLGACLVAGELRQLMAAAGGLLAGVLIAALASRLLFRPGAASA